MDIEIVSSVAIIEKEAELQGALVVVKFSTVVGQWRAETRHGDPLPNEHKFWEASDDKIFMATVHEPLYFVLRGEGGSIEIDITMN